MSRMPFATVIIPTYNQGSYLGQALDSLLSQTDADWEAVVVNDGSTDNTKDIAEEYARRDSRIRCIHKPNGGVASALNAGLSNARGEWIHWLSSDDLFEPHKLAINREWITRHPETNFFFSYFTLLTEATQKQERRELWGPVPTPGHELLTLFYRNYISGISICVRRSAWEIIGFFDETLHYAQDYNQWLRLLQKNQGRFIPDWTVVSRNHAAQGSETFPDACYFDTAKAALRFINQHSFAEIVPWANLIDDAVAAKAVAYALDVACDRTAFLYSLGPHPALVLRVLEWVFSTKCMQPAIKAMVRTRISEMSFIEGDDDWAWMWRQLSLAVQEGDRHFPYVSIDPSQLALCEWRSKQINGDSKQTPLRQYLLRFESIDPDLVLPPASFNERIVFLIDRTFPEMNDLLTAADLLAKRGYRSLVVIEDRAAESPAWEWSGWVPIIRVASFDRNSMPWLGEVELAVTLPGSTCGIWLGSRARLTLADNLSAASIEQSILNVVDHEVEQSLRPVVFLERILWGGGAERVVFDLARYLDRRKYRPMIWTMFNEHTVGPKLPPDIEVRNIMTGVEMSGGRTESTDIAQPQVAHPPVHAIHHPVRLHKFYHRMVDPALRQRIGLGRRLVAFKQQLLGLKRRRLTRKIVHFVHPVHPVEVRPAEVASIPGFDFVSAMAHHNPLAANLARTRSGIGKDAVVITVMEEAAVTAWLAQAESRFPHVVSLHTLESACLPDIYPDPMRLKAEKWLLSAACNSANSVTLPSQGCSDDLADNFAVSPAKIRKIWNPVDCSRVRRLSFQQLTSVEAWRSRKPHFRMVHVGRLDPQKNHALLLSVCAELKKRRRDFSLAIIGEGSSRPGIQNTIHMFGLNEHVFLAGEQSNPFPWLAAADALLLTSRFEAFALVLVEAMVCGTPVISVDCPTGPSEVLNKGEYGLLVPPGDPAALADAVERLMDDPVFAQKMTELGYERAQMFDVKNIVRDWETLIDAMPSVNA